MKELYVILVFAGSSIFVTCLKYVSPDFLVSSNVRSGIVLFFYDGKAIGNMMILRWWILKDFLVNRMPKLYMKLRMIKHHRRAEKNIK